MADPIDIDVARTEKAAKDRKREAFVKMDGNSWTVEDMLKDALAEVLKDRDVIQGVFVYIYRTSNNAYKVGFSQAGMTRVEEVGFLELAKQSAIDDWKL